MPSSKTAPRARHGQSKDKVDKEVTAVLQRLLRIVPGQSRVLSCYVRLETKDRERSRYLIDLENRVKSMKAHLEHAGLEREGRLAVERDLVRIVDHVKSLADLPHSRGLAIFACEALDLFVAVPMPRTHRLRLVLDDTPWIRELLVTEREGAPIIVVALDRGHSRFFEVSPGTARELSSVRSAATRGGKFTGDRRDAPGFGERDYHGRIEEERHRHYASVARELGHLVAHTPVRGVVVAGPEDHTAALLRFLPRHVGDLLVGTTKVNPTATTVAEVQAAALAVVEEHDRLAVAREVRRLEESMGEGWAVSGPRETLLALSKGQVRTLFVRSDLEQLGFRCAGTGRLVLMKPDCRGEGEPQAVLDVMDEAVEEALSQGADVVAIDDPMQASVIGDMAALLRFR
jgi:peptide subunit release factor 1 (eRF1)